MAKLNGYSILSIAVLVLGALLFIGAISGFLFEDPTEVTDIGLWSVTIVMFTLGGFGLWASMSEAADAE